jgi:hypothetical protein
LPRFALLLVCKALLFTTSRVALMVFFVLLTEEFLPNLAAVLGRCALRTGALWIEKSRLLEACQLIEPENARG